MKDVRTHYAIVGERLGRLGDLMLDDSRRKYFEESLAANELELALHTLCDFLLEPGGPHVSRAVLRDIESLHSLNED